MLGTAALSIHYYSVPGEKPKKDIAVVVHPTSTAAAAAQPPQPINPAGVGAAGSYNRPFDYNTHAVVVYLEQLRFRQ